MLILSVIHTIQLQMDGSYLTLSEVQAIKEFVCIFIALKGIIVMAMSSEWSIMLIWVFGRMLQKTLMLHWYATWCCRWRTLTKRGKKCLHLMSDFQQWWGKVGTNLTPSRIWMWYNGSLQAWYNNLYARRLMEAYGSMPKHHWQVVSYSVGERCHKHRKHMAARV